MVNRRFIGVFGALLLTAAMVCGCTMQDKKAAPYDAKEYIDEAYVTPEGQDLEKAAAAQEDEYNFYTDLSVPTYITKVDGTWFIVDCYHNLVLYSDSIDVPLTEWKIMCKDVTQPHTIASDGLVYLIDDTENDRLFVYEKADGKFIYSQLMYNIGDRPHYSYYDEMSDTFYVLSSESGEIYCFRHTQESSKLYLTDIRKIDRLKDVYVRSFTIIGGDIYFVSGVSETGAAPEILRCDLKTMEVKKSYPVPNELAGMVQLMKIDDYYYITVSTDITGNQDYATIVRARSLDDLAEGEYEDIYSEYFIGGGTPYNISKVDDTYFLTEHRLKGHSIWSFKVDGDKIYDVETVY